MRPLEINLATRPFRNNTLYWAGFGSATLVLAVLTSVNLWLFFRSGSSVHQYEQEVVVKQQKRDPLARDEQRLSVKLAKLDFNGLRQEAEFANDAIRRRIFSWTELFNRLEEVVPPDVMMTALRPEIQAEGISIVAEGIAKNQEGLLDLEENLIQSAYFARIYPGSERREQRGGELHFSLKFDYLPPGHPGEAPAAPVKKAVKSTQEIAKKSNGTVPAPEPPRKEPVAPVAGAVPAGSGGSAVPTTVPAAPILQASVPPANAPPAAPSTGAPANVAQPGPPGSAAPQRRAPSPAPGIRPAIPPGVKRGRPAGRPMLKGRPGVPVRIASGPGANLEEEKMVEEAAAAASFVNRPLEDVIDYLMKNRSLAFVFDGSFDLRQKVNMDVWDKEVREIADMLAEKLGAVVSMEAENTLRISPVKPPETLEEPPVEEEPVPADEPPEEEEQPEEDGR